MQESGLALPRPLLLSSSSPINAAQYVADITIIPATCRYTNTSAVISKISYIDGEKGVLRYRGYPIEELAQQSNMMEVAYLVLFGSLPTQPQLTTFREVS